MTKNIFVSNFMSSNLQLWQAISNWCLKCFVKRCLPCVLLFKFAHYYCFALCISWIMQDVKSVFIQEWVRWYNFQNEYGAILCSHMLLSLSTGVEYKYLIFDFFYVLMCFINSQIHSQIGLYNNLLKGHNNKKKISDHL